MRERPRSLRRRRGRPVSDSVDRALAAAALEEFILRGYQAMSMESIAARAGVSKVSLYRRWSSKLAIATEVLQFLSKTTTPVEDHGSLRHDCWPAFPLLSDASGGGRRGCIEQSG